MAVPIKLIQKRLLCNSFQAFDGSESEGALTDSMGYESQTLSLVLPQIDLEDMEVCYNITIAVAMY